MLMLRLSLCLVLTVWFVCNSGTVQMVRAQNQTTHPEEARALNTIFKVWNITATPSWNISGELCTGDAVNDAVTLESNDHNPFIKCVCSFENGTICRIFALKVKAKDIKGSIPEELWTLVYLNSLNLNQNFLTGPLSPRIGNLNRMQWMTFGANALSGPVPKEIGLLTDLRSLALDTNSFSGSLPAEIGKCTRLQKIYIASSGLTGEIPSSFANLVELEEAWMNDIQLTGRIPEFIGKWTKLSALRILGTNLSGPVPSSFANLISMTELRLGDISNSNSTLEFIRDMKSLSVLVLRNNNLMGTIPSNIGEYVNLRQLDLSFNNLTGQIPASLFNSSQLTHLFLGNNKLNGSLPTQKSSSLSNIDISYNDLAGSLPSWVSLPNQQLNLIANHFTLEGSTRRVFPGLDCLQKNFPCNRGKGIYFNFSVNCGGPEIRSTSGALYEKDEEGLGPASFFVSKAQRWAVSNVGLFTGSNSNQYIALSSNIQFANKLFESARLSTSSLRYYGLGLENGGYTVTVQFFEIQIQGSNTWRSLGRRVFDIYVQGKLVEKDFDIRTTANRSDVQVVQREYKAIVSENYLEIHLFWAGKGTCCVPFAGAYGPLVSAISTTPDFKPTVGNKLPSKNKKKVGIIVGAIVGAGMISILVFALILIIRRKRKRAANEEVLLGFDIKPYTFNYSELKTATQDFDPSNKLGEGGYGPVYKGKLNDGREIAVKQLSVASRQGKDQFVAEIATISAVQHRNLVKLYGCCIEDDQRLLVYEYLSNKSLDQALFGLSEENSLQLSWSDRFGICLGVAKGLAYMHEESSLRIVHRDVKASNILLDSDLIPKISDFGLAKLYDDKKTHMTSRVAGTIGYLSPEYAMLGHLTEKTDVFAFGIVALEIVSGRPNSSPDLDDDQKCLLEWAWSLHQKSNDVELIDPYLTIFDEEEVKRVICVAFLCTQTDHTIRPTMSRVVGMLTGNVEVNEAFAKPGYYVSERTFENDMSFLETRKHSTSSPLISDRHY